MTDLETAVAEDARGRPKAGRVLRAQCAGLSPKGGRGAPERDLAARRARFSCTAVTSEIDSGGVRGGVIGYPYRALVQFRTGRLAWCRIAGRPGEGAFTKPAEVEISARCGG